MEIKRICNECGKVSCLNANTLIKQDCYTESGEYYQIMYFVCSDCGEKNVVQADTIETINILSALKSIVYKAMIKQGKGQTVSPKDIRRKDKLSKQLKRKREKINEKIAGVKMYDENKEIVFEHLTFIGEGGIIESNL